VPFVDLSCPGEVSDERQADPCPPCALVQVTGVQTLVLGQGWERWNSSISAPLGNDVPLAKATMRAILESTEGRPAQPWDHSSYGKGWKHSVSRSALKSESMTAELLIFNMT